MAALPYMKLYVSEYLADTTHLDAEEHGAYLMLLFNYWQTGKPLPNDDTLLARYARVKPDRWPTVRNVIQHLFSICSTHWVHHRMDVDLEEVSKEVENKSKAGKASAAAKKRKAIKDRKSGVARTSTEKNTRSTPVEQNGNKEEVEEEVKENKKINISPEYLALAESMSIRIAPLTKKPKPPNLDTWADELRKLIEIDGRPIETAARVFGWANQHSFWQAQILSPANLRKHFDRLIAQMGTETTHAPSRPGTAADRMRAELARLESS